MRDKHRYRVHRYRVQSGEKLPRRPVWHSIYSTSLGWEVLRLIQVAKHRRTFGKHRASWPNSTLNFEKESCITIERSYRRCQQKTSRPALVSDLGAPRSVSLRLTLRVKRRQADMVTRGNKQASMSSSFLKIPFPQHHYITEIAV